MTMDDDDTTRKGGSRDHFAHVEWFKLQVLIAIHDEHPKHPKHPKFCKQFPSSFRGNGTIHDSMTWDGHRTPQIEHSGHLVVGTGALDFMVAPWQFGGHPGKSGKSQREVMWMTCISPLLCRITYTYL